MRVSAIQREVAPCAMRLRGARLGPVSPICRSNDVALGHAAGREEEEDAHAPTGMAGTCERPRTT
jgi:hypothetical protein